MRTRSRSSNCRLAASLRFSCSTLDVAPAGFLAAIGGLPEAASGLTLRRVVFGVKVVLINERHCHGGFDDIELSLAAGADSKRLGAHEVLWILPPDLGTVFASLCHVGAPRFTA